MSHFLAENQGIVGFYDNVLEPVPTPSVLLSEQDYYALLSANARGARLALRDGKAVALDWQGDVIDLSTMTKDSTYFKPETLADKARRALQNVQQQASMITAMGEVFGPKTRAYVQSLRAIINGSDTTSTELPDMPSDVTV